MTLMETFTIYCSSWEEWWQFNAIEIYF